MSVRLVDIQKDFADPERVGGIMTAVRDMNLEIREGEFITLLGPSGCGKTTTLRMVAGFEIPSKGQIWRNDQMGNEIPPNKRDTTMVFQSYAIFPHMSVEQNVGFGLELKGKPRAEIREETAKVMEVMGITELGKRRPDQLSGGQQQRVALARAVVNKPRVLLFDEPLSNLDAKLRETMRVEIRRIQQAFGITSIYVTHDQSEAMTVSDRIVVMEKGLVMQVGTPFEVYSRPSGKFVADFIGKVNLFPVTVVDSGDRPIVKDSRGNDIPAGSVAGNIKSGAEALLMVRPESLRLGSKGVESSFGEGKVVKAVYLGSVIEYEIDAGYEKPLMAISHDPVNGEFFKVGDSVSFSFSRKAAHILPKS